MTLDELTWKDKASTNDVQVDEDTEKSLLVDNLYYNTNHMDAVILRNEVQI